jgi:peptide/nickel transport system permease protein
MFKVIRDLLKYDRRFRIAIIFLGVVMLMFFLSFFAPYDPNEIFVVPMDVPPSPEYFFGTNSRGQDIFWWMTSAVRNSLLLGVITAVISRVISIIIGLSAGYEGGWLDKFLMSINDSFIVLPLLPILILLGFLLRDIMNL